MAFSLDHVDLEELKAKVETALDSLEQVLTALAPVEELLPLPASAKTALADLQKVLAVVASVLAKV